MYNINELVTVLDEERFSCNVGNCVQPAIIRLPENEDFCREHGQLLARNIMQSLSKESNPTQPNAN